MQTTVSKPSGGNGTLGSSLLRKHVNAANRNGYFYTITEINAALETLAVSTS